MIKLGTGRLDWTRGERITDRYGAFHLDGHAPLAATKHVGQRGRLVARVVEPRVSRHMGDFARGFYPPKVPPLVGEEIVLGIGTLFVDDDCVGLRPDDGRESFWLDPKALYRAHSQGVDLFFDAEEK